MKKFKQCISQSVLGVSLLATSVSSHASLIQDISEELKNHIEFPTAPFKIIHERDIYFKEDPKILSKLDVQMSAKLLDKDEYLDKFSNFEIDSLTDNFKNSDKALISKTIAVLKNVRPEFFTASKLTSQEWLSKTVHDVSFEITDPTHYIVKQVKDFSFKKISVSIQYESYNFRSKNGMGMNEASALKLANAFPLENSPVPHDELPELVVSMKSGPADVTYGSHGGRTVNFYYPLNEKDTLLIAYKLLTIKKEALMVGHIWNMVQNLSEKNLYAQAKETIELQRSYFLEHPSLEEAKEDL